MVESVLSLQPSEAILKESYKIVTAFSAHPNHERGNEKLEHQETRQHQLLVEALAFSGHEWRNQIAKLIIVSENLLHGVYGPLNPRQVDAAEQIRQSASAMRCIANNYLNLAKSMDFAFRFRPAFIDPVKDVIEPVIRSYAIWLERSGQTCQIKADTPDMLVWADPDLLTSVYDNLLCNAIKYGEPGGQIIFNLTDRGIGDEFSVWNSGPGVPAHQRERILERFETGSAAGEVGTGIGLYLARKIVEAHGGILWIESEPGAWANVIFMLPKREYDGSLAPSSNLLPEQK